MRNATLFQLPIKKFKLVCFILLVAASILQPRVLPAVTVQDISDGKYLDSVLHLIQKARESIYISMYIINPKESDKHPVGQLMEALLEARKRKVKITIWMNSAFDPENAVDREKFAAFWEKIKSKGIKVHMATRSKRLHDKLVVVDGEWVVDGSTNWTLAALKKNSESDSLIHSKELAQEKIKRLNELLLEPDEPKEKAT